MPDETKEAAHDGGSLPPHETLADLGEADGDVPASAESVTIEVAEEVSIDVIEEEPLAADEPELRRPVAPPPPPPSAPAVAPPIRSVPPDGAGALARTGASQLPPAPVEAIEAIAAAVARLRAEAEAATDASRRARLLHEAAEIQEGGGDDSGAARDYLAAYNTDTTFREPLEGLVRVLERRRSIANLGKLIEALASSAVTPEEHARALTQRALFAELVQEDLEGARGLAREATETGAGPADVGAAWLALERVAAKLGDAAQREEALAGRAERTEEPLWRGLLWIDVASLAASSGDVDRALSILQEPRKIGGAPFRATAAIERIVRADPGLPGSAEAEARADALARGLEARATLVAEATRSAEAGDATGVPRSCRAVEHVVDLLLRAAGVRRGLGELDAAAALLDRALAHAASPEIGDRRRALEPVALAERLRVAELAGDAPLAAELAARRLEIETDGGVAASLALRVAEHAAAKGDHASALEVLARATERDPMSAPVRALKLDLLDRSGDGAAFAAELEGLSGQLTASDARSRALVLAAYVWATRAGSAERAREALRRAADAGLAKDVVARLGRALASVRGDRAWYEEATVALVEELGAEATPSPELPMLWTELARTRLLRDDEAGAAAAIASLRDHPDGAWLGRVLEGLASPEVDPARARTALEELAADVEDAALARTLRVVCALRAREAGDMASAIGHLDALAREDASDPLVTAWLGDLLRASGDRAAAARLALTAAEALDASGEDPARTAARWLEAGFEAWRAGDRTAALGSFTAAERTAPASASPAVAWGSRGMDVDSVDGRRRALDLAGGDASVALERFALEASLGDPDEAASALTSVDLASNPSVRLAGALARAAWPRAVATDHEALLAALDSIANTGEAGRAAAAAERLRLAREDAMGDPNACADAAREWLAAGGGFTAAVEWLASAIASGEPERELPARHALAELASDEAHESLHASAALLAAALAPDEEHAPVAGTSHAARLANLELAPPGAEPRARAAALAGLEGALGETSAVDAGALGAWSALVAGDASGALELFRRVVAVYPDDLHAWEGVRTCAEELGDGELYASSCEQLGARCANPARGAAFWEQAALTWQQLGADRGDRAEIALDASFARDPSRAIAFDRLFRRVRERKDHDKLLAVIARRLDVVDDPSEMAKLFWEQARALREKGDPDGALDALEHVTTFDEDHVGALALTGEIFIRRGMFEEAAEKLAHLARVEAAPPKNRVTAGVAAVDLYENKLGRHDLALEVLLGLHAARLTTLPVRERLARAAARTGAWSEATKILEELMNERPEREGRIEAARLAMAIHRDRTRMPAAAITAVKKLLEEAPTDGEAIDLVVGLDASVVERGPLLERARDALLMSLHESPANVDAQRRLVRIAHTLGDAVLEHAAASCAVALRGADASIEQTLAQHASRKPRTPQVTITDAMMRQLVASGDDGPLTELFIALGPTLAEALGPTRESLGVTKKDRVDPKAGLALRSEIAQWAGAFGISNFDLYVGGRDPAGVQGIAGDPPAIVVGAGVSAPLSPAMRARVVRELVAIVRGTTALRSRDDTTVAAVVVAACNLAKVRVEAPPFAVLAEVERLLGKAIARKTKAAIEPICRAYAASSADARQWAGRARMTQARCAALASGDVSVVLGELEADPGTGTGAARDELRAHELLRFVLSRPYFDVRRALGLEGQR